MIQSLYNLLLTSFAGSVPSVADQAFCHLASYFFSGMLIALPFVIIYGFIRRVL